MDGHLHLGAFHQEQSRQSQRVFEQRNIESYYHMSWLKKAQRQKRAAASLQSSDIIDAFVVNELLQSGRLTDEQVSVLNFEMNVLKDKIVRIFTKMMREQVAKYAGRRDRYVKQTLDWLKTYPTADAAELALMLDTATTRSARHQRATGEVRNVKWGEIGYKVAELNMSNDAKRIVSTLIDQGGLFNLIHNTGGPILGKLPGGGSLMEALNFAAQAREPKMLIPRASSDIREMAQTVSV